MKKAIILLVFLFLLSLNNVNAWYIPGSYSFSSQKNCIDDYLSTRETAFQFCENSVWRWLFKSITYSPFGFLTNAFLWTRDKIDWVFDTTCEKYKRKREDIYKVCRTTIDNYYKNIDINRKKKSCPKKYPGTIYNPQNDNCVCPYWDANWWNTTVKNWCYYPILEVKSDLANKIIKTLDKKIWKIDNKKEVTYIKKLINIFWQYSKKLYYAEDLKSKKLREKYWNTLVDLWIYLSVKLKNDTWIYSNDNMFLKYYHIKMRDKLNVKLKK